MSDSAMRRKAAAYTEAGLSRLWNRFRSAASQAQPDLTDLSADTAVDWLPASALRQRHRRLLDRLRGTLGYLRAHSVRVAVESTRLRKVTQQAHASADRQEEFSELIVTSSSETATALEDITERTATISELNSRNMDTVRDSNRSLNQVAERIGTTTDLIDGFKGTVTGLNDSSTRIRDILELVQGFSSRTNLLALNAAIEAARAGEHGRGFAVVAEEVRDLSEKVASATDDIAGIIDAMSQQVQQTEQGTAELLDHNAETQRLVQGATEQFDHMVQGLETTHDDLLAIGSSIEQISVTNREIHRRSGDIQTLGRDLAAEIRQSDNHSASLREATEETLGLLADYRTGSGRLEEVLDQRRQLQAWFEQQLAQLQTEGVPVFDRDYVPVPDTDPQQFLTRYVEAFKSAFQQAVDDSKRAFPGTAYSLIVDINGYLAVHHAEVSRPPTGDPAQDLLYSRDQRQYFSNETEQRRARNTRPFLLQTYIRDTGEILNDISLPLYINGEHWGALVMGFDPELILEDNRETETAS
ncbi:methyl-accepting chemotaxis protein [Natronospirillum operosum]|uniref:Methyl-accepting chemotaxis protein n=1 Tax=Natronospirillum operosum TaxID=2759953 RepID=A0A4Z0WCC1_9GAMM|nr:methyl-accepting chemotaxis protein [Natronospirillum operosum]TGG94185.1 methyl-accepting chemotaxis protein [Natronospirillum operosum]